jgi:pimeloyl-ACP methyl ester carboxylesterase
MAEPILVPQVGQDLTEAKVVAIYVKVGDPVKKGDIVAEVESEKATFEVEAFISGVVLDLPYSVGDTATVLAPLALVGQPGEATQATAATSPAAPATLSAGEGSDRPVRSAVHPTGHAAATPQPADGALRSSPLARRLAALKGIDLGAIRGTGPRGAIVMRDVEAADAPTVAGATALKLAPGPSRNADLLNIQVLQEGAGHPIVFLHGFGSDLSSWRPFVGRLSIGNPMIGIDLPAHGGSAGHEADGLAAIVDRVAATLLATGHHRVHLVGHSLGAAVAASVSDRGDLDVRSLTLIAPAGLGPKVDGDFISGFLGSVSEAALGTWMRRLVHAPASLPGAFVRATLGARDGTELATAQGRLAQSLFEGSTQLFSIRDALARYEGPCRIIVGRRDVVIPADQATSVPGNVAVNRIDAVGHLPHVEAAALVGRLVAETVRASG